MIGLTEEQPLDLASLSDGIELLARAARPSRSKEPPAAPEWMRTPRS